MTDAVQLLSSIAAAGAVHVANSFIWTAAAAIPAGMWLMRTRRVDAATKHALWWLLLFSVLAVPLMMALRSETSQADRVQEVLPRIALSSITVEPNRPAGLTMEKHKETSLNIEPRAKNLQIQVTPGSWSILLAGLWAAVLIAQLARIACGYAHLRRLKQTARPAPLTLRLCLDEWMMNCRFKRGAKLLVSDSVAVPLALGFIRPVVLLPAQLIEQLEENHMDHVLLHELGHLARRDDWSNLILRLLAGAASLHPLAFWMIRQIDIEREAACDEWVVAVTGNAKPYARSLVRLFENQVSYRSSLLASGMASSRSHLRIRIESLLRGNARFSTSASRLAWTATGFAGVLVWLAASSPALFSIVAAAPLPEPQTAAQPAPSPRPAAAKPNAASAPRRTATQSAPQPPAPAKSASPEPAPAPNQGSFLTALNEAGYGGLSVDQIIELKVQGVDAAFIRSMNASGWGKLTPGQLVELKVHGVSGEYLAGLKAAGLRDLAFRDVVELKIHGVNAGRIQEMHALGFGPYTARQHIEFSIHGVGVEELRALKDAGFASAEPREIVEARIHGVSAKNLAEAKKFSDRLTLRQVIKMKQAGVI